MFLRPVRFPTGRQKGSPPVISILTVGGESVNFRARNRYGEGFLPVDSAERSLLCLERHLTRIKTAPKVRDWLDCADAGLRGRRIND